MSYYLMPKAPNGRTLMPCDHWGGGGGGGEAQPKNKQTTSYIHFISQNVYRGGGGEMKG